MNEATRDLIVDALRFFVWAGGEGILAIDPAIPDPDDTILNYARATGDEDVEKYPEKIGAMLDTKAAGIPVREG